MDVDTMMHAAPKAQQLEDDANYARDDNMTRKLLSDIATLSPYCALTDRKHVCHFKHLQPHHQPLLQPGRPSEISKSRSTFGDQKGIRGCIWAEG